MRLHVAVGAVVEHHRRPPRGCGRRGGELLTLIHEAAVAGDRDHLRRARDLGAERGRVAPAECALVAGRQEGARLLRPERRRGGVAHLRELVDEQALLGQPARIASRYAICGCSFAIWRATSASRPAISSRWRGPLAVVLGMRSSRRRSDRVPRRRAAPRAASVADHLLGSMSMRMIFSVFRRPSRAANAGACRWPARHRPRSHSLCRQAGNAERMAAVHHAMAHAVGDHRRPQHLGQSRHLGAGVLGAAADYDQRALGLAQHLGRGLDRVRRSGAGRERRPAIARHHVAACPRRPAGIPAPTGRGRPETICRNASSASRGGARAAPDAGRPFGERAHDAELVGDVVQVAECRGRHARRHLAADRQHRRVLP